MECEDGSEISSRIYCGREDGVMGSLAAGGAQHSNLLAKMECGHETAKLRQLFTGPAV
jgi:hypothetical protein